MIYNFRHDRTFSEEITQRIIEHNELSQGWGGGVDPNHDLDLLNPEFVENCVEYYNLQGARIPNNLTMITEFMDGDLIVTPHLPQFDSVSIHVVNGDFPKCYRYDENDDTHQNHRILVNQSIGLDNEICLSNANLVEYRTALRSLRLPVMAIPQFEELFLEIIQEF